MAYVTTDGDSYDPNQRTDNTGFSGYGFETGVPTPTIDQPPTLTTTGGSAPPNNPSAAPEQDFWGAFSGTRPTNQTSQQAAFQEAFQNYWAPDRSRQLASLRYQPQAAPTTPTAPQNFGSAPAGFDATKWMDPTHQTDKYLAGRLIGSGGTIDQVLAALNANGGRYTKVGQDTIKDSNGDIYDLIFDQDNATGQRRPQWTLVGGPTWEAQNRSGGAAGGNGPFGSGAPSAQGGIFSDPGTAQWEQLIRQLVDRMNQAQPTWTPAQLDLQQTQALDPLERQRTQQKQQEALRLSSRGITPGSGIYDEAMRNIDQQFNQLRTRTQASFANTAINREDQLFANNEQRSLNAANLFKQIPQYADQRLQLAQGTLIPANPYQAFNLANSAQNYAQQNAMYQQAQQQQFWANLAQMISSYFNGR